MTRTSKASDMRPNQGRPLGLLMHWLMATVAPGVSHGDSFFKKPSLEERQLAREQFKYLPDAEVLLSRERVRREDEPEEPIGLP